MSQSETQIKPCRHCGHTDTFGRKECPRCGNNLNSSPIQEGPRRQGLQTLLFIVILLFAIFPYLKKNFPAIEKRVDPGNYIERQADKLVDQKNYKGALPLYKEALTKGTLFSKLRTRRERSRVHYKIALCHVYLKQNDKAIFHGEKAISVYKRWRMPLPYEMLLYLYTFNKKSKRVDWIAPKYEQRFGRRWRTWASLGNAYGRLNAHKKAKKYYLTGLKRFPKNPTLLNGYAWILTLKANSDKKQLKEALTIAEKANKIARSRRFAILNTLAEIHFRLGDTKRALSYSKQAFKRALRAEKTVATMRLKWFEQASLPTPPQPNTQVTSRPTPSSRPTTPSTQPSAPIPTTQPSKPRIPILRFAPVPIPRGKAHNRSRQLLPPPQ